MFKTFSTTDTLASLLVAGRGSELDFAGDAAADMLDRETFLLSCEADELADAAEFFALIVTQ